MSPESPELEIKPYVPTGMLPHLIPYQTATENFASTLWVKSLRQIAALAA